MSAAAGAAIAFSLLVAIAILAVLAAYFFASVLPGIFVDFDNATDSTLSAASSTYAKLTRGIGSTVIVTAGGIQSQVGNVAVAIAETQDLVDGTFAVYNGFAASLPSQLATTVTAIGTAVGGFSNGVINAFNAIPTAIDVAIANLAVNVEAFFTQDCSAINSALGI